MLEPSFELEDEFLGNHSEYRKAIRLVEPRSNLYLGITHSLKPSYTTKSTRVLEVMFGGNECQATTILEQLIVSVAIVDH